MRLDQTNGVCRGDTGLSHEKLADSAASGKECGGWVFFDAYPKESQCSSPVINCLKGVLVAALFTVGVVGLAGLGKGFIPKDLAIGLAAGGFGLAAAGVTMAGCANFLSGTSLKRSFGLE